MIYCIDCHQRKISPTGQRCRPCRDNILRNTSRNEEVVKRINSGERSVDVGRGIGLSRERIRQIYFKTTGKNPGVLIEVNKERKRQQHLDEVAFTCLNCGYKVTFRERGRSTSYRWCMSCRLKYHPRGSSHRDLNTRRNCLVCGHIFFPWNVPTSRGQKFCSSSCYNKSRLDMALNARMNR